MSARRPSIVVLGMMSKIPVSGVVWQTVHYLVGFQRLGYDVTYVEAHGRTPSMLMARPEDDGSARAAAFIDRVLRQFDLGDRWAFHALHLDGRCYGLSEAALSRAYRSAALLVNLHGGTEPLPQHYETGRLVYVETDPVALQVELHDDVRATVEFLEPHVAFFTFGENLAGRDCGLPVDDRFSFHPTRQPVVLDFWATDAHSGEAYTTVANWRQLWRDVTFAGQQYTWSKHYEFANVLELPERTGKTFDLALGSYDEADLRLLEAHGWRVRPATELSDDLHAYRAFVAGSRGEFTVAKDQNVRLRTGWFSDRSATYLAAGRPVVTQDTGFGNVLPTGEGLHAFSSLDEAAAAIEAIEGAYGRQSAGALAVARECFSADIVLRRLLADVGVELPGRRGRPQLGPFPAELVLEPARRRPTTLTKATQLMVLSRALSPPAGESSSTVAASVVIVTFDGLPFTRLCLETLLADREGPEEIVVVDNASSDGTTDYLRRLARLHPHVEVLENGENMGFPHAANQGLAAASTSVLVLLNNDAILPPGSLRRLVRHLENPSVALAGPVTNRIGNEAEIASSYRTYGEFLAFGERVAQEHAGETSELGTAAMYCVALRRDVYESVGPLDERFGVGLLEDDDYAQRARAAGLRVICAEDVFVHHFGEASFGRLVADGEYGRLLATNKAHFAAKWGEPWTPYERRETPEYDHVRELVRCGVAGAVPSGSTVLVVSRGDDRLLELQGRCGWHFPQTHDGTYAGHHPADSKEAIAHLEELRERGGNYLVFPATGLWWLEYYGGLRSHLDSRYRAVGRPEDGCVIYALDGEGSD